MIQRDALRASVKTVTPPASLPVAVQDVLDDLGLDVSESGRVSRLIGSATELMEAFTHRVFISRTLELQLDQFPHGRVPWWDGVREGTVRWFAGDGIITLPKPPLIAVQSVKYFDVDNQEYTVPASTYYVDDVSEPGRVVLNLGATWPTSVRDRAAVTVTYTAGYGSTFASVPYAVYEAMLSHVRDVIERPNANIASESIDNASVSFNANTVQGAMMNGGLRGDAAAILASLRVYESGL